MSQIEKDLTSYKHWSKVNDLAPSDFKNLTRFCNMLRGRQTYAKARINNKLYMCLSK